MEKLYLFYRSLLAWRRAATKRLLYKSLKKARGGEEAFSGPQESLASQPRNIGFAGQRTMNMLKEMGDEMAGMGLGSGLNGFQNEEDYMMRQPTAVKPQENPPVAEPQRQAQHPHLGTLARGEDTLASRGESSCGWGGLPLLNVRVRLG